MRRGMKGEPSREYILTCRGYAEVLGMVDACWQHNYYDESRVDSI